jgi:hypothetical protein
MKKHSISLIEVIVSLGLLSLLLSTLFFWHHLTLKQKQEFNARKGPLLEERYAHQRLQNILGKADVTMCTTYPDHSLVFLFDRGPCEIPELSGKLLGRLYVDTARHTLCLGVWPNPHSEKTEPSQTTILLNDVLECSFHFYFPPDPFKQPVNPEEVGKCRPRDGWQEEWRGEYWTLPALIKMCIKRPSKKEPFAYTIDYLFDFSFPVVYAKEHV